MQFKNFNTLVQNKFRQIQQGQLFSVDLVGYPDHQTGYKLWDIYLSSFRDGDDPVFRDPNSSHHNCNNDKNFIKRYGNIVTIDKGKIITMWDLELPEESKYYLPCKAMSEALKAGVITNVFKESFDFLHKANYQKTSNKMAEYQLGNDFNNKQYSKEEAAKFGAVNSNDVYTFYHFNVTLNKSFVHFGSTSIESVLGELRTSRQLFEKGLNIPIDSLELVRDLIQQGSLLRGDMYLNKVVEFIKLKKEFDLVPMAEKSGWMWLKFQSVPFARFANELIGTTAIELAEGKDLNKVCKDFNIRVDPTNYAQAKSPVTQGMIKEAEKQIAELGYSQSFDRIPATIDHISIDEIKHSNIDNTIDKPVGLFAASGVKTSTRHKRAEFDTVETVTIDNFMSKILPHSTSIEVYLENKMEGNLVALFTEQVKGSKNMFKWNNPFSWTYNGNLSGKSMIKDAVKEKGGNVTGVLRASMIWNETGRDNSDLDLWCLQPNGEEIGYNTGFRKDRTNKFSSCGGQLDLDNTSPGTSLGVENIYFQDLGRMRSGKYKFWVNQFSARNSQGFKFEIETNGEVFNYSYDRPVSNRVPVATVTLINGQFTIEHHLPHSSSNKNLWGLETNEFHKVNLVCTSPNYWGDNNIGTKEYFFMLQGCQPESEMKAFHTDHLNSELSNIRKAIGLLGNYKMVPPSKGLAGVGYNSTVSDSVIVKVKGSHSRVIKIQF